LQAGAVFIRVISTREDSCADAIKYAFAGDVALDYVRGYLLGLELSDILFGLSSVRRCFDLHRKKRALRARHPEQYKNKRQRKE
jgi:hypothetical protein